MLRYLFAISIAVLALVTQANTTLHAQTTSAQEQERLSTLVDIRKSVVHSMGATDQTVEVIVERNVLIVLRVNSNMNESTHAGRDNEATAIASIASKAISGKAAFKDVVSLQVRYVIREGSSDKAIDTVEFREDANGNFQHHQT